MTIRVPPAKPDLSSEVWTVDFREKAPAGANTTMYEKGTNASQIGGLSVAVPGELRGFQVAHEKWGSLPWKQLVLPSVELAAGFKVGVELGRRIPVSEASK